MTTKQDRSNAYYLRVLKLKHPDIYKDYKAARYGSVRQALLAAGIKKPQTRLQLLKGAWRKATAAEKAQFGHWLRTLGGVPLKSSSGSTAGRAGRPIAVARRLEPWAKSRIKTIIGRRHMTLGDVMAELGFPRRNGSLGNALNQGMRLQPNVLSALEKWILDNARI